MIATHVQFFDFKNIEKIFAFWESIYIKKKSLSLFFNKKNKGNLMERFSFFGMSVSFFISSFSDLVFPPRKDENNQNNSFIFIACHTVYPFQKNWNQEILQDIDFFQKVLALKFVRIGDNKEKDRLVKLIDLILTPFSYILGIDIKSLQNKILSSTLNKTGFGNFDLVLKEKSEFNVFQNSIKISLFMDIGFYLKLLFVKKKNSKFSSKEKLSNICFYHYFLSKTLSCAQKKILIPSKQIRLVFLKILPGKQNFRLIEVKLLRRKLNHLFI